MLVMVIVVKAFVVALQSRRKGKRRVIGGQIIISILASGAKHSLLVEKWQAVVEYKCAMLLKEHIDHVIYILCTSWDVVVFWFFVKKVPHVDQSNHGKAKKGSAVRWGKPLWVLCLPQISSHLRTTTHSTHSPLSTDGQTNLTIKTTQNRPRRTSSLFRP